MFMAKSKEEAIKKANGIRLYIETETQYWIETEKGIVKILKPLPKEYIINKLKNGEFPEKYIKEIFKPQKTKALEKTLKVKEKGLILSGRAGIGKTFACIFKIAKQVRYYKIAAPLYISLQDFEVHKEYFTERRLKEYDCILLDDLNPNLNKLEKRFAETVIYHAYNNQKRLYITTNASIDELFKYLNEEPVISRLLEICETKEIEEAEDLRIRR